MNLPVINNCGACCMHMGGTPSVLAWRSSPADALAVGLGEPLPPELNAQMLQQIDAWLRDDNWPGDEPCVWLDLDTRRCKHYEHRPDVCREFEVGGEGCRDHRGKGDRVKPFDPMARAQNAEPSLFDMGVVGPTSEPFAPATIEIPKRRGHAPIAETSRAAHAAANLTDARRQWLAWLATQPAGEGTHDAYCAATGAPASSSGRRARQQQRSAGGVLCRRPLHRHRAPRADPRPGQGPRVADHATGSGCHHFWRCFMKAAGYMVFYYDDDCACFPMGLDPECDGAIEVDTSAPVLFTTRIAARRAIRISTARARLLQAQGEPYNEDFTTGLKNVRIFAIKPSGGGKR